MAPANEADLIVADPQRGSTVYGLATDGTCLPLNIIYTPPQLGTQPAITTPYTVVFMQNGGQSVWMTSNTSNSATPPVSTEVTAAQPRYLANALASIDSRELSKTVCGPIDYEHSEHQANFIVTAQTIPSRSSDAAVTLDTVECSVNLAAEAMGSGAGCRGCSVNASHQVKRDALINMIVFFSFSSIAWWAMKKKMLGIR
ncbi:MAG: hypothetical protein IPJ69_00925 [Deltaproteobacteria bacterium]|nr:MAG: hypothetical protein IPJ69_00925 [Deltaproteobacteria bacterium]